MVALGQTITIVNKSGKVVKTSKHLVNVWNEAKSAYNERKAEIKALRRDEADSKDRDRKARSRMAALTIEDDVDSRSSSRQGSRSKRTDGPQTSKPRTERPIVERGYTDSFYANDTQVARRSPRPSPLRHDSHGSFRTSEPRAGELTRRHTTDLQLHHHRPTTPTRSASLDDIDMNLAYGELPPPLPERNYDTEVELRSKMTSLQTLLDECNCFQHSVTAIIDNLQKNPDALAAVALTLGEISTLASKMAPGALMSMKGSFPVIIAILASPQFAIAVGVGVGVTVIAFGGYKIIKKIKAKKEAKLLEDGHLAYPAIEANEPESPMDELREIDHIELWRRGIADADLDSAAGTSVEGEFVTPIATRTLIEEGKLTEADFKSTTSGKEKKRRKKSSKSSESGSKSSKVKVKVKKEPSLLKQLFTKSA
ncbi:hypothetical protein LTR10_004332 [Elasticomyces elasticus]|nr:hypothetical protein LTR10_004332 [Elasticomyces elasticus]KAK4976652.1 hypothetical protein LTR42_002695 [Elasticomyces elasticus]